MKRKRRAETAGVGQPALARLAALIRKNEPVLFVTGSGISAPSGIPTFRGANNAVWANWIMDWGTRARFLADPRTWWNTFWLPAHVVAYEDQPSAPGGRPRTRTYQPNAAHSAIARICQRHPRTAVVTQNIDELHQRAGLPLGQLVEVHGRQGLLKCVAAGCPFATTESVEAPPMSLAFVEALPAEAACDAAGQAPSEAVAGSPRAVQLEGPLPTCPACRAPAMPQSLFFDELYESHTFYQYRKVRRWLRGAKAVVFAGTSHAVTVTHNALETAAERRIECYDFNLHVPEMPSLPDVVPPLTVYHVLGGCELTLPLLAALVEDDSGRIHEGIDSMWREGKSTLNVAALPRRRGAKKKKTSRRGGQQR